MDIETLIACGGAVLCGLGAGVVLGQIVGILDRHRFVAIGAVASMVAGAAAWIGAELSAS